MEEEYIKKEEVINKKYNKSARINNDIEDYFNSYLLIKCSAKFNTHEQKNKYISINGFILIHSNKWIHYLNNRTYPLLYYKDSYLFKFYNEEEYLNVLTITSISNDKYILLKELFGEIFGEFIH